jgi:hypothetical protein
VRPLPAGLGGETIPSELRDLAKTLEKETRAPLLLHWVGLAILAAFIGWAAAIAGMRNDRGNKAFLATPHAGNVYTVRAKANDKNYSLLKVVSNEFEINHHPVDELNVPDKYSKGSFSPSNFELQIMQNKGQLTDVDRPGE